MSNLYETWWRVFSQVIDPGGHFKSYLDSLHRAVGIKSRFFTYLHKSHLSHTCKHSHRFMDSLGSLWWGHSIGWATEEMVCDHFTLWKRFCIGTAIGTAMSAIAWCNAALPSCGWCPWDMPCEIFHHSDTFWAPWVKMTLCVGFRGFLSETRPNLVNTWWPYTKVVGNMLMKPRVKSGVNPTYLPETTILWRDCRCVCVSG